MTSEGEFKQRIRQWWAEGYVEDLSIEEKLVGTNDAPFEILDEARKEFPEVFIPPHGTQAWCNPEKAATWFLKWFGSGKNIKQRIKEKIDEMGGTAVARRKMGIAIPSGMKIDSKLMHEYKEEKK